MRWIKPHALSALAVAFGVASLFYGWPPATVALALLGREAWAATLAARASKARSADIEVLENRMLELESWRQRQELRAVSGGRL